MKKIGYLVIAGFLCVGCGRGPETATSGRISEPSGAASGQSPTAARTPISLPLPESGTAGGGLVYPERTEVTAMLHQARELSLKSRFQEALELVTQALQLDPQSPGARRMEYELVETMKRIRPAGNVRREIPAASADAKRAA